MRRLHGPPPRSWMPWLGLALSLVLVGLAWFMVGREEAGTRKVRFETRAAFTAERIERRMFEHEQVLLGTAQYLTAVQGRLPRATWRAFADSLDLSRHNPGVQALGYAEAFPAWGLDAHQRRVRAEGFPDYRVVPGGPLPPQEGLSAIILIHPMDARNQRAFGRDMHGEARRREAMDRARDTGLPSLSAPVTLYQESEAGIQAGTLLYVPVYRPGAPLESVAQRRQALLGWAYMAFRMGDLLRGILGDAPGDPLSLALVDRATGEALAREGPEPSTGGPRERALAVAGRTWTLRTAPAPAPGAPGPWGLPGAQGLVLVPGLLLCATLFLLLRTLAGAERRAQAMADERHERLELLLDSTAEALVGVDPEGRCTFCNPAFLRLTGHRRVQDVLGRRLHPLLHHSRTDGHPLPEAACRVLEAVRMGRDARLEEVFWKADGTPFPVECLSHPQVRDGRVVGAVVSFVDITDRVAARTALEEAAERLSLATQAGGAGLWEVDLASGAAVWDSAMHRLHGLAPEAFAGTREAWADLAPPGDRAVALAAFSQPPPQELDVTFRVQTPEGLRILRLRGRTRRDAHGVARSLVGTARDVTEARTAEERLRWQASLLALMTDPSPLAFLAVEDGTERILYHNPKFVEIWGLEALAPLLEGGGATRADILPACLPLLKDAAAFLAHFGPLQEEAACVEDLVPLRDGRTLRRHAVPMGRGPGDLPARFYLFEDVSDRVRLEARLRTAESNFRALFDSMEDLLLVARPDGILLHANEAVSRRLGWRNGDLASLHLLELAPEARRAQAQELLSDLVKGARASAPLDLVGRDGTRLPVDLRVWFGHWGGRECLFAQARPLPPRRSLRRVAPGPGALFAD